jgi:hypothetical protein
MRFGCNGSAGKQGADAVLIKGAARVNVRLLEVTLVQSKTAAQDTALQSQSAERDSFNLVSIPLSLPFHLGALGS